MNNPFENTVWFEYIATPRGTSAPVKLDRILRQRMKTFMKTRRVQPCAELPK